MHEEKDVKLTGLSQMVVKLSGGNQQKVIVSPGHITLWNTGGGKEARKGYYPYSEQRGRSHDSTGPGSYERCHDGQYQGARRDHHWRATASLQPLKKKKHVQIVPLLVQTGKGNFL